MLKYTRLQHRFVNNIPEKLEPGVIYVSIEYATAVHLCCCGCGEEAVTPITPTDWKLTFDGDTISLSPSIGNWNYRCRSHYFIKRNFVHEALPWSMEKIDESRKDDARKKREYYGTENEEKGKLLDDSQKTEQKSASGGFWDFLRRKR